MNLIVAKGGNVHILRSSPGPEATYHGQTLCKNWISTHPGQLKTGTLDDVTCKRCKKRVEEKNAGQGALFT
jgi:hypothetical protein